MRARACDAADLPFDFNFNVAVVVHSMLRNVEPAAFPILLDQLWLQPGCGNHSYDLANMTLSAKMSNSNPLPDLRSNL